MNPKPTIDLPGWQSIIWMKNRNWNRSQLNQSQPPRADDVNVYFAIDGVTALNVGLSIDADCLQIESWCRFWIFIASNEQEQLRRPKEMERRRDNRF